MIAYSLNAGSSGAGRNVATAISMRVRRRSQSAVINQTQSERPPCSGFGPTTT